MVKLYVDTELRASSTGEVLPIKIRAGYDGEWVEIEKARNDGIKPSLVAGGIGVRYTCDIVYQEEPRKVYVYRNGDKWFIEADG